MLKFAVLCFLVIMASTSAEQCGDQVCGAGTCCAEYPEMHCKRVGQLYDICVDAQATKDSRVLIDSRIPLVPCQF
uniref:U25-Hexatoxin-Hc1bu_1 n=1 Tax=Hadronyche cerberea TaxID=1107879 RepID=A0A4Q8K8I4_HADCE